MAGRSIIESSLGLPGGNWRWATVGFVALALAAGILAVAAPQQAQWAGVALLVGIAAFGLLVLYSVWQRKWLGGADARRIAEAAAKVFGTPAHLGETPAWVAENLRDPGYNTALGLLYYGVSAQNERGPAPRRSGGFLSGMKRLFANV